MAVYQSGTEPIVRRRSLQQMVSHQGFTYLPHVTARHLRKEFKVPRKARWTVQIENGYDIHRFEWYEVETNA